VLGVICLLLLPVVLAPTALACPQGSDDRAAQALLAKAVAATRVWFGQHGVYTGFDAAQGAIIEPSVTWEDGDRTVVNQVNINAVTVTTVMVETQSGIGDELLLRRRRDGQHLSWSGPRRGQLPQPRRLRRRQRLVDRTDIIWVCGPSTNRVDIGS
jgi:hypothetical protein